MAVQQALKLLEAWAQALQKNIGSTGVYVFGSLIHRDGRQFSSNSDIDLVVCFPHGMDSALSRLDWLVALHAEKIKLETSLANLLGRDPNVPICSFVVPTLFDIGGDLHKDGASGFFAGNYFLDLTTGAKTTGLPGAGAKPISNALAQNCVRFAQKKRNQYLDVSADGTTSFAPFDGNEPLPKDVMRHAAMAAELSTPGAEPGSQFDVQFGLDFVSNGLYAERASNKYVEDVHDRLSVRRGARGQRASLAERDQVFLAEWILDRAFLAVTAAQKAAAKAPPALREHSTVLFASRFARAFPGISGVESFANVEDIKERMLILLAKPLVFVNESPIWWFRDGNSPIEKFDVYGDGLFLMDGAELKIRKIVAASSSSYYKQFVYVEADAMPATGLYKTNLSQAVAHFGYSWEEYGIVDGKHLITRKELDDGSAKVDGKLQKITGRSELRIRYLTAYNFVIAAEGSPINDPNFDSVLKNFLDDILKRTAKVEDLAAAVGRLRKKH